MIAGSNPAGAMDVCHLSVCCVLSVRGLCVGLIIRPEESYGDVVSKCDRESEIMRMYWPSGAVVIWYCPTGSVVIWYWPTWSVVIWHWPTGAVVI